jgi:hypothetical protein
LLATDSESTESIGLWADSAEVVTSCSTALVVRVQHEQEGDVAVTVMTAEKPPAAIPVFDAPQSATHVFVLLDE